MDVGKNIQHKLARMIARIDMHLYQLSLFLPKDYFVDDFDEILEFIPKIKIDPLKLVFRVWHKALKKEGAATKGTYSNLKAVERLLFEFKKIKKDTTQGYLFNSLYTGKNLDTARKTIYKKHKDPKIRDSYDRLINFIYDKSFMGETSPITGNISFFVLRNPELFEKPEGDRGGRAKCGMGLAKPPELKRDARR